MRMAKEMLDADFIRQCEVYDAETHRAIEYRKGQAIEKADLILLVGKEPTMYSSADVVSKASELYSFVNNTRA